VIIIANNKKAKNMKKLAILGSTGNVGTQVLEVVDKYPNKLKVIALSANGNIELLKKQIKKYQPMFVGVADEKKAFKLKEQIKVPVFFGEKANIQIAELEEYDTLVNSVVSLAGIEATLKAIEKKKNVALANKETLVAAGEIVMRKARKKGVKIMPIDSEHSALFQCLNGEELNRINRIWLTASGGPFRNFSREELASVSKEQALNHPKWCMGSKVTIDSSTLMNKGFEMIEAKWLFDVNPSQIEIVIHPQSIVHSMVEFSDTSVISQMGVPDMRVPIQYAFTYPKRVKSDFKSVDFFQLSNLTFEKPDLNVFKNLTYAYESIEKGGNMPCILNAANEIAVEAFLNDKISYLAMFDILEQTMQNATFVVSPSLDDYFESDFEARKIAVELISKL